MNETLEIVDDSNELLDDQSSRLLVVRKYKHLQIKLIRSILFKITHRVYILAQN